MFPSNFSPSRCIIFRLLLQIIPALLIFLIALSCKDDPEAIGIDVLPGSDKITGHKVDTLAIEAYTLELDSIYSTNRLKSPLGSYVDPIFGAMKADFITQFTPTSTIIMPANPVADSVILRLYYNLAKKEYYVQSPVAKLPQMTVHKLTEKLGDTMAYYSNFNTDGIYDPDPISISEPFLGPYRGDSALSVIHFRLSPQYGQELLNIPDTVYKKGEYLVTEFPKYIYGLYVKTEMNAFDNVIPYIDLLQDSTSLTLHYHTDTIKRVMEFGVFSSYDMQVNLSSFDHNTSRMPHLNDTLVQDTAIYIQSLGGTMAYIKIPGLQRLRESLGEGNVSVNKAEIIFPVETDDITSTIYERPAQLGLHYLDANSRPQYLPDDPTVLGADAAGYFGGRYDILRKAYIFNISNFMHQYLSGKIDSKGFRLFSAELVKYSSELSRIEHNAVGAERVVLTSGKNSKPIQLRIYYTFIK
jgi:hypothetical protein